MRITRTSCLVLFLLASAVESRADPYTILPDGSVVFNAMFSTTGVFTCHPEVPCTGTGSNTVTLGTGSNMATLTFTGVDTSAAVGNVAVPIVLGEFTSAPIGEGFTFPSRSNPNAAILSLHFTLSQSSPTEGTRTVRWDFGPSAGTMLPLLEAHGDAILFGAGPNPIGYPTLAYSLKPYPFSLSSVGVTPLGAEAGAIPEPATFVLVGTGLGLAVLRRRGRCPRARSAR